MRDLLAIKALFKLKSSDLKLVYLKYSGRENDCFCYFRNCFVPKHML